MAARLSGLLAGLLLITALTACGPEEDTAARPPAPPGTTAPAHSPPPTTPAAAAVPLRHGEHRKTLSMPATYTPSAPNGVGTDDYRCFLLDPGLVDPAFLTGTTILPGNPDVVHHVILFRADPGEVSQAQTMDDADPGEGWTCFGGTGLLGDFANLDDADWLGAWAPGGRESVMPAGYGVGLEPGTQIIMQVHYNLLATPDGQREPDRSAAQLRLRPGTARLTPLHTMLLPAPVELPCRPSHDQSPLCDRAAAVADVKARFGDGPGSTNDALYFLCGGHPHPSEVTSCTRHVRQPLTILGVAGHMHLLGRRITIEVDPGTPRARTILDIPVWDFDNQGAIPIDPVHLDRWDSVKVTCKHVQWLRDRLPSFRDQPERYVVWGEGTTDEMCLGMLQVAFDSDLDPGRS